jgi:hypothetical protein
VGLRSGLSELKSETSKIEMPEVPRASASTSTPSCQRRQKYAYVPVSPFLFTLLMDEDQSLLSLNTGRPGEHVLSKYLSSRTYNACYKRTYQSGRRGGAANTFDCGVEDTFDCGVERRAETEKRRCRRSLVIFCERKHCQAPMSTPARPRGAV